MTTAIRPTLTDLFPGNSIMSRLMRAHPWESTPLGPPEFWPLALRIPLRMMLESRFEMWLGWGPDMAFFYNDAYIPTLGVKHPEALGRPAREVWAEVYGDVRDRWSAVLDNAQTTWDESMLLLLSRSGYLEETYHTFSYSPLRLDDGTVGGLYCVVSEDTERVIDTRRLGTLRSLASALVTARSRDQVLQSALTALHGNRKDFPFALLILSNEANDQGPLRTVRALAEAQPLQSVDWPIDDWLQARRTVRFGLADLIDLPPTGDWSLAPQEALAVPIAQAGHDEPSGLLVVGINPYRPGDAGVASLAQLVAGQIAGAIANVDAYDAELKRVDSLRVLFAQSPSFMAVLSGPDHRFEMVNPAYLQLIAHRDVIGRTVGEALPEVTGQGFIELLDQVYQSGEPFSGRSVPITMQRAPGAPPELSHLDFVYQPIRGDDGLVRGIFVEGFDVSDVHRADAARRQSEEQFLAFAQAMPIQVWACSPQGRLDWFNQQTLSYSGFSQQDLLGKGWSRLLHPDDMAEATERWWRALSTGEHFEVEYRIRRVDGEYRWHLVRAMPIRQDDGTITRWVGTNTDIHQRKLLEDESHRDRNRIWRLSRELMLITDFQGVVKSANPAACRILGWSENELIGRDLVRFVHPDDRPRTVAELGRLAVGHTTAAFENRMMTRQSAVVVIAWTAAPEAGRLHVVGRDVTEEREIAQELDRTWALSPVLMVVGDRQGLITAVNPSWSRVLGWSPTETIGHDVMKFVAPEDVEAGAAVMRQLGDGEPVVEFQNTFLTKEGKRRRISWTTVPEDGRLYAYGRDITAQAEAQAALSAAEAALRQSQKMEAVGQLTGGIAHDFNNLLQGITGSLSLVQKRIRQGRLDEVDRYMDGAVSSANRAAGLTHRLLAFSRRQPLDPRPVRVNPLIQSMEDLLRRTLSERIELRLVLADRLWMTLCDANQLESAVLNLAINARDAMPDGGRLTVTTRNVTFAAQADPGNAATGPAGITPGPYVSVAVTDTGCGMSADVAGRVFEPFFTTKPIGQGTGLGLSMIYGFARQSEGDVRLISTEGQGTTVTLYLPRFHGRGGDAAALANASGASKGDGGGAIVLVVEDEPVVRDLVVEVLREMDYVVIEAKDGNSGLEAIRQQRRIDLLLTDIGLPGLNGRQLADVAMKLHPELKVLLMTGYAENATLASGFMTEGMSMIAKPFDIELLTRRISEILEQS